MVRPAVQDERRRSDDATRTAKPDSREVARTESAAQSPSPIKVRDRERYDIRGEQGRGGLGLVWRAHDRELGRDVAVKELLSRSNVAELRFFREAMITSRLEHPNIVPVHEAGRWPDGTPFYTMKLVGGRSLHSLIAEQPSIEGRLALVPNVIAVADAIAYAHERRVIHRDLKPSNVMVGEHGETIVIDWGLAKVLDNDADNDGDDDLPYRSRARNDLTAAGSLLGTPAYMAPEQYDGRADERSDIYALGGILYQLLSGRAPHSSRATLEHTEPSFRFGRGAPKDLAAIARRALAQDPAKRYQSARDLAEDLKRYTRRDRVAARRYSIAGRLALLFARHRAIAVVLVGALLALTITFGIALVNIRRQRAEADAARRVAVVNNAAAMLERDPTRAWEILRSLSPSDSPALLRARIQAAGVAERKIALPGRWDGGQVLASGDRVVIATGERTLHILDARTGELIQLADGLTEPVVWAATDERVYFVRGTERLSIAEVPIDGGAIVDIATVDALPRYMLAAKSGAFWLSADGSLLHAMRGQAARVVARDVGAFELFGDHFVICGKDLSLRLGPLDGAASIIGTCDPDGPLHVIADRFTHATRDNLYVYGAGQLKAVPATGASVMTQAVGTSTGLVAGIGAERDGLVLLPGGNAVQRIPLSGTPQLVSAVGNLAGWSFADGTVEIMDTADGRHWSIRATAGRLRCFALLAEDRVMTCDRQEVRLWTLPSSAPATIAALPVIANNVVFDASGNALLDGVDGHGYLIRHGERFATPVHKHDGVSFGAAWCDAQACTSGWDGKVLCTDAKTGEARVAASLQSVAPWLASGGGHCFTAAASGGIYDLRSPQQPVYRHDYEPYRVAVSPDGQYVASGDWGGDVIVYDVRRQKIAASTAAHVGRVTNVVWVGNQLLSSGADGVLRLWSPLLEEQRNWRMSAAVRYLEAGGGTIAATLDDGTLWMLSARDPIEQHVRVGSQMTAVGVSPNGRVIAAGTNDGELIVLSADHRAAAARFGQGHISCLSFESDNAIALCAVAGRVMRVPLSSLSFQSRLGADL